MDVKRISTKRIEYIVKVLCFLFFKGFRREDLREDEKDVSINAAVKDAIHKDELRKIVSKACEDGKLSEDSKACKYVEKDVD